MCCLLAKLVRVKPGLLIIYVGRISNMRSVVFRVLKPPMWESINLKVARHNSSMSCVYSTLQA